MKHKIFALVAVVMVAVASVNAYFAYDSELSSFVDLQEGDVEAVAEGESYQVNHWMHWLSYGFFMDEREEKRDCPTISSEKTEVNVNGNYKGANVGAGVGTSSTQASNSGRYEIICPHGDSNCDVS